MIVFDLQCPSHHVFEGWFAGEGDFQLQCQQGLVLCPLCGDAGVSKRLSAPRLNLGVHAPPELSRSLTPDVKTDDTETLLQQAWLDVARKVVANTDDVGPNFSREARRIHYGEAPERGIRGYATSADAAALIDEGIPVMAFSIPEGFKKTLQ